MKKIIALLLLTGTPAFADMGTVSDQFLASLTKDMAAVVSHTSKGTNKAEFLTSLIQLGHYKTDYILGFDFGLIGAESIRKTYGAHLHLTPFVLNHIPMNPDLAAFLSHVELTPRYSYDEDVNHGVLSYVFGAKISY